MDFQLNSRKAYIAGEGPLVDRCKTSLEAEGALASTSDISNVDIVVFVTPPHPACGLNALDSAKASTDWQRSVEALAEAFGEALPGMRERGEGRLIWIGPIAAKTLGGSDDALAVVSGLGALGLVKAIAGEAGPDGVTCNAILYDSQSDPSIEATATFLASGVSSYLTGAAIAVDGGKNSGVY